MNSNIDFQSVCLGTILYSSTEIIDFSWQLYFFLVNFKSEIWQIYVIRRHHCQSTRRSYLPLLIFSYKGISILYYSMDAPYKNATITSKKSTQVFDDQASHLALLSIKSLMEGWLKYSKIISLYLRWILKFSFQLAYFMWSQGERFGLMAENGWSCHTNHFFSLASILGPELPIKSKYLPNVLGQTYWVFQPSLH